MTLMFDQVGDAAPRRSFGKSYASIVIATPKIVLLSVSIRRMSKGSGPSAMAPPARVDRTQRLRGSQQWNLPDECLADDITGSPPQGVRRIFYSGTPMQLEAGFPRFDGRVRAT